MVDAHQREELELDHVAYCGSDVGGREGQVDIRVADANYVHLLSRRAGARRHRGGDRHARRGRRHLGIDQAGAGEDDRRSDSGGEMHLEEKMDG